MILMTIYLIFPMEGIRKSKAVIIEIILLRYEIKRGNGMKYHMDISSIIHMNMMI